VTNFLSPRTDAANPGLAGLHSLTAGLGLGTAEDQERLTLWAVEGDEVRGLGTFDDRPLAQAHCVSALLDPARGRSLLPIGEQMMAFDLAERRIRVAWPLPNDDGLWQMRRVGDVLLARGRRLWAWRLTDGALLWSGPEEEAEDWTCSSEGALVGVSSCGEGEAPRLIVRSLLDKGGRVEIALPNAHGAHQYLGPVSLLNGGTSVLCARRVAREGGVFDEVLLYRGGHWSTLGAWSARVAPVSYGLAACAVVDDEWAKVAGREANGARYSTLIHLNTASHHPIPNQAQTAPGGWSLGAYGAVFHALRGDRWRLTPDPARALSLAPDGRSAFALVGDRVLGWAW
jgi:hypothetical protein